MSLDGSRGAGRRVAVVDAVGEGGLAHFNDSYCTALAEAGAVVRLFTSSRWQVGSERPYEVDRGIRLWPAYESPSPSAGRVRRVIRRFRRKLRRPYRALLLAVGMWRAVGRALAWNPDVVQLTRAEHNPASPLLRRRVHRRGGVVVELVHEFGDREHRRGIALGPLLAQLTDWVSPPDGFVFLSAGVRDTFLRHRPAAVGRSALVPHGTSRIGQADPSDVDRARRRFGVGERPLLLMFGAIRPSKGIEVLLEALALLPTKLAYTMVIAGYPTAAVRPEALRSHAARLALDERVVFDFRYLDDDEIAVLLEVASLVVLPYVTASQSGVLHRAQAHGVPVVASRVGEIAEVVEDGVEGLLVSPNDAAELSRTIERVLTEPEVLATLTANAVRRSTQSGGWTATGTGVVNAYAEWCERRR